MKHMLAGLLRTIATIACHVADELEPPPPVKAVWPFAVHTSSGTAAHEARITWH